MNRTNHYITVHGKKFSLGTALSMYQPYSLLYTDRAEFTRVSFKSRQSLKPEIKTGIPKSATLQPPS